MCFNGEWSYIGTPDDAEARDLFKLFVEAAAGKRPGVGMLLRRPELRTTDGT